MNAHPPTQNTKLTWKNRKNAHFLPSHLRSTAAIIVSVETEEQKSDEGGITRLPLTNAVTVDNSRDSGHVFPPFQVIPIVTHDDDTEELSEEELAKRREFERKRKEVATPEGLDIKAVLGHRISIPSGDGDDDEDESEEKEEEEEEEEEGEEEEAEEEWKDDGRERDTQKLETGDGVAGNATPSSPKCTPSAQKV